MVNPSSSIVTIRAYAQPDAVATLTIFTEAITRTASAHYTAEQIQAWAQPDQRDLFSWHAAMESRNSVVATIEGEVAGFSDNDRSGYIDMMFVSPKHLRCGVARQLLAVRSTRP